MEQKLKKGMFQEGKIYSNEKMFPDVKKVSRIHKIIQSTRLI